MRVKLCVSWTLTTTVASRRMRCAPSSGPSAWRKGKQTGFTRSLRKMGQEGLITSASCRRSGPTWICQEWSRSRSRRIQVAAVAPLQLTAGRVQRETLQRLLLLCRECPREMVTRRFKRARPHRAHRLVRQPRLAAAGLSHWKVRGQSAARHARPLWRKRSLRIAQRALPLHAALHAFLSRLAAATRSAWRVLSRLVTLHARQCWPIGTAARSNCGRRRREGLHARWHRQGAILRTCLHSECRKTRRTSLSRLSFLHRLRLQRKRAVGGLWAFSARRWTRTGATMVAPVLALPAAAQLRHQRARGLEGECSALPSELIRLRVVVWLARGLC